MNVLATQIPWCWIIPIIVGILCAILGYLLGRLFGNKNSNNKDEDSHDAIAKLEADLEACKKQKSVLKADLQECYKVKLDLEKGLSSEDSSINANLGAAAFSGGSVSSDVAFDAAAAKAIFGKKIKHNDLKIIEGIGPKIEGLFHNFDIKTWKDLSNTSIEKCQEVLNSGGDRYRIHKPGTWPEQAKFAYEGKWKELQEWQDKLNGGKA
ncbi:hypothetical protein SAMN04489761_3268 [Tenacibaculum sp. MAR_2009_124]|uniref:hypothetical protein n=1 Tax=Tenacibaculum sp. MAR_2009_124 TaxID=1250059 RepID=UPI000898E377|nr:hypothetical protein [Tenacibaculum sp. MAR_2009_124]SEC53971.1 hypothetical protein SAMN04489761_3268 [Tenacibaculum sp. MAR_2009_124]